MLTRQQESYYALEREVIQLREALEEMLFAFSMKNIGLEASKRRLEAKKRARAALSSEKPTRTVLVFPGDPDLELKK